MRKIFACGITTAVIMGSASIACAAENPFADVPQGHWAYDAVGELSRDGVITGYEEGSFRGKRLLTRYEMAQLTAKAVAKEEGLTQVQKSYVEKLSVEFHEELENLGVRIKELERHADKVKWKGLVRYSYSDKRMKGSGKTEQGRHSQHICFRLEPTAEITEHWKAHARLDARLRCESDRESEIVIEKGYFTGHYGKLYVTLGRFSLFPAGESGALFDDDVTGVHFTYGKDWKLEVLLGRIAKEIVHGKGKGEYPSDFLMANAVYDSGKKLFGGVGFFHVKDDDFKTAKAYSEIPTNMADILSLHAGYHFKNAEIFALWAKNYRADWENTAYELCLQYGNAEHSKKGSWDVYLDYRRVGYNVALIPEIDDIFRGTQGVAFGADWTVQKNMVLRAKCFKGRMLSGATDVSGFFSRLEFFF